MIQNISDHYKLHINQSGIFSSDGKALHISWTKCCLCVCACLYVNRGGANRDCCTKVQGSKVQGTTSQWSWASYLQLCASVGFLQCFDTVGLVIWPVKLIPEMTYNVLSGTLNLYITTSLHRKFDHPCDRPIWHIRAWLPQSSIGAIKNSIVPKGGRRKYRMLTLVWPTGDGDAECQYVQCCNVWCQLRVCYLRQFRHCLFLVAFLVLVKFVPFLVCCQST